MSLCPEAKTRAEMTDAEFWEHVFGIPAHDPFHWLAYEPDIWAIECARCGCTVEISEETATDRERDAFCDDCATEHLPYEESTA